MYSSTLNTMNRKEIAKIAGVSTATLSRYFNQPHLLSREIRVVLDEIVQKYNYQPNALASQLAKRSKGKIALIYYPSDSLFDYQRFQAVYYLLLTELNKLPISLVLITDPTQEINRNQFDKIIFCGSHDEKSLNVKFDLALFPDDLNIQNENYIFIEPNEVGQTLAELFIPASKLIPLILLPSGYQHSFLNSVIESFKETLKKHSAFPNPHHFIEGADSFESGQATTAEAFILGLDFHSIIAFNQEAALGAISALKSEGMAYPFDVQVVHYGHPKEYYFNEHDITCLSDPLYLIIDNIIKFINGKKIQMQLSPLLIEGRTY